MQKNLNAIASALILVLTATACHSSVTPMIPAYTPSTVATGIRPNVAWAGKIKHVIIIDQENRSLDNMFNGFPGADTQTWGLDHNNKRVNLIQISEATPYDIDHTHHAFTTAYNNGKLNGWDLERVTACKQGPGIVCPPKNLRMYGIVPRVESQPYWDMARQGGLGDRMFQSNEGPSFPSHQYIISGTSTISDGSAIRASENPIDPAGHNTGGCDSPKNSWVRLIDAAGNENRRMYPCFQRLTLMDLPTRSRSDGTITSFPINPISGTPSMQSRACPNQSTTTAMSPRHRRESSATSLMAI